MPRKKSLTTLRKRVIAMEVSTVANALVAFLTSREIYFERNGFTCLILGFLLTVGFGMPTWGVASSVRRWVGWPPWVGLFLGAVISAYLVLVFFLNVTMNDPTSTVTNADAVRAVLAMAALSAVYGAARLLLDALYADKPDPTEARGIP
jgi:hypothetical protein